MIDRLISSSGRYLRIHAFCPLLVCAVFLLSACTGAAAVGPSTPVGPPKAVLPTVIAATVTSAGEDRATVMPSANAKATKPGKEGKTDKQGQEGREGQLTPTAPDAGPFLAPEMLGRPTDHSMTMNILPAEALEVYVEYGATPGIYTDQTSTATLAGGQPTEITLDDLQPDTRTFYRVRYRAPGATDFAGGEERSVVTQRAPGSAFTFAIQGDSHPERVNKQFDAELYVRALNNAAADRPDFYLTIGDDFSVDNSQDGQRGHGHAALHEAASNGWGWWKRRCSWSTATTSRLRWRTWTARPTT